MIQASTAACLFDGLFDDASLFPPGDLPMVDAVAGHVRHQAAWYGPMSGPFVCPDSQIAQLRVALTAASLAGMAVSLVVTGGAAALDSAIDAVVTDPRLRLRSVEVPAIRPGGTGPETSQADTAAAVAEVIAALDMVPLASTAGYVEIPLTALGDDVLGPVLEHGYRPKLRTGGMTAAAFPDEAGLAACLAELADRRLPFKCTAGLHHAVRHTAADTGYEHHGFLNVLLAVAAAVDGAPAQEIAAVLAQRDARQVAAQVAGLDQGQASRARALFSSFGTCSTDEPVADLAALGLVSGE